MGGLGAKGAEKLRGLVQRTDAKSMETAPETAEPAEKKLKGGKVVRKGYAIPFELSEELREYCHKTRRKEVHVIIEALEMLLAGERENSK